MGTGRKCEFDKGQALHNAMLTFWERGYLGASLSELTSRMGINKPSMYAAFGNKEELFLKALDYYLEGYGATHLKELDAVGVSVKEKLLNFVLSVVKMQFETDLPRGCLVSQCVADSPSGSLPSDVISKLEFIQQSTEQYILHFFEKAKSQGELAADFDSANSAKLIGVLLHGTAVMAKSGKCFADIQPCMIQAVQQLPL